ncbi:MAG: MlaD family protein, partial [Rhodanobacteraceae bacterium]
METRAHHVLIGAFTLVVVVLGLLFALWLGKASLSRQHHYYDIVFTEAVTGLSKGSPVQY